jgi:flagellar hook protein FlgE
MSINSAMRAGVSGLVANSAALAAISDNIANVNTVGYKRNQTDFQTLVTAANVRGSYTAGGVFATNRQEISKQGLLQQTTSSTDLAISGQGFFVTTDKATDLSPDDARYFTRAGSFQVGADGYLKNSAGLYLQGWVADSDGVITPNPNLQALGSINLSNIGGVAIPTTRANISANLKANLPYSAAAIAKRDATPGAYDPADPLLNMSGYDASAGTGVKPDVSIQIPVGDSKGVKHTVQLDFLRSAENPNQWYAELHAIPADEIEGGVAGDTLAAGIIAFDTDGNFDPTNSTLFADMTNPTLDIGASLSGDPVAWADEIGASGQTIRFDFGLEPGFMTQLASPTTQQVTTNGTAFGGLASIDISEDGFVVANFDNGSSRTLAQVAVATFPNPDGLQPVSGNAFRASLNSGAFNLKIPGEAGAGQISASSLEASTVDLSSEFTGLITTQRAYSASSKIITTADQMLEELLNIKR